MPKRSDEIVRAAPDGTETRMLASEAARIYGRTVYIALKYGERYLGCMWRWADGRPVASAEERRQRRREQGRLSRRRRREMDYLLRTVSVGEAVAAFAALFPDPERAKNEMLAMLGMPLETIMKAAARYYMRNKCIISSDGWIETRDRFLKEMKNDGDETD